MWNLWSLFLNVVAIIITIVAFPEGKNKSIIIVFLLLAFFILGLYTLTRSVQLKGLLAWMQVRRNLGIHSIHRRGDEHNEELFNRISRSHNLKIMALSSGPLMHHYKAAIITALVERNCNVKVLTAQEASDFVKEVETLEGPERKGQISTEIEHAKTRLKEIVRLANEQSQDSSRSIGRIWIGRYNTALRGSLIICDKSWGWYTPNLPPKRSIESVSFEIEQVANGLLEDCISHFDAIWMMCDNSRQIEEITLEETKI